MELAKLLEELLVVIVFFRQKPEQSAAYTSVCAALNIFASSPEIFIYDNSPESCLVDGGIAYVHDPANNGVSTAYNLAAAFASRKNKKWMLLLDQDTTVEPKLFKKWSEAVLTYPDSVAFVPVMKDSRGVVSPFHFSSGRGKRINILRKRFALDRYRFINSGLFIQCAAFLNVGGYDEDIPLDFSDISFGERLLKITDHFVVVDSSLQHEFSVSSGLSLRQALGRFHYFCRGALCLGNKTRRPIVFFVRTFYHATRLSLSYRNSGFFKIFLQYYIDG